MNSTDSVPMAQIWDEHHPHGRYTSYQVERVFEPEDDPDLSLPVAQPLPRITNLTHPSAQKKSQSFSIVEKVGKLLAELLNMILKMENYLNAPPGTKPQIIQNIEQLIVQRNESTGEEKQQYRKELQSALNTAFYETLTRADRVIQQELARILRATIEDVEQAIATAIRADEILGRTLH